MNFIEMKTRLGTRFMLDFDSQWEIHDRGDKEPAQWVNHQLGRNLDAQDVYESLRARLVTTNPMLSLG